MAFKNMTIKKIFDFIHLYLGLVSGVVVFVVSITGCLYVFEEEARGIFQAKYFYVETPTNQARKTLFEISDAVKKAYPKEKITQIRFESAPESAYLYHTKTKKAISVNPYTLQIAGVRNLESDFFVFILDLHRTLKLGEIGEQIIKWNVLIFLVLCISGFVLWLPKQRKFLKQALTVKWKTKNWKRLNWDLHSVLGFYGLFILILVSLTGIFWVFDSAKNLVSVITGEKITKTKAPENKMKDSTKIFLMESAYYAAKKQYSGELQTFISNPEKANQPIRVLFRYPYSLIRKQNTLFFDKNTGEILREDLHKNYNNYDKVMRSNYDFHTGSMPIFGIGSKILYFLASLFAASLPITGFLIWWGRRKKTKVDKVKNNQIEIYQTPKSMKKIVLTFLTIVLPLLTMAHGYWLETKGSGKVGEPVKVLLFYGEYASEIREKGNKLDKMVDILVSVIDPKGERVSIKMAQTETHWEGDFTANQEGNYQIIGINDTREVQDWHKHKLGITRPVQFVRTNYLVGNTELTSVKNYQFLDIIPNRQGEFVAITAYKDGQLLPNTSIKIINPQTWEKTKVSNERGKITFLPTAKGMYLVEIEWIDKTPGTFKGKSYETIRYKSETTVFVN